MIYFEPGTGNVKIVEEVETSESINDEEARGQWANYQHLARFGLIVPRGRGEAAKAIATRNGVSLGYVVEFALLEGQYRFEEKN